jgi:acetyl esterase/lipase
VAAGAVVPHAAAARPTVVLLHEGGFVLPAPPQTERRVRYLEGLGFRVVVPNYPLDDPCAAQQYVRDEVGAMAPPPYVLGISSGGNLAVDLAARRLVPAAAVIAPPVDLRAWGPTLVMTDVQRASCSPILLSGPFAPLLVLHSPDDEIVPFAQSVALAQRAHARLIRLHGAHLESHSAFGVAARWLARRARSSVVCRRSSRSQPRARRGPRSASARRAARAPRGARACGRPARTGPP